MKKSLVLIFALLVAFSIMAPAFAVPTAGDDSPTKTEKKKSSKKKGGKKKDEAPKKEG